MIKKILMLNTFLLFFVFMANITAYGEDETINAYADYMESNEVEEQKIKATDIELGDYETEMYVGKSQNISATVIPSEAVATVTYTSSNQDVLKVSSSGDVKAVSAGSATITIKADDIIKNIDINVLIPTSNIELNSNYVVLQQGEEFLLKASVKPYNADWGISYVSSDESVVKVDYTGKLTAVSKGHATIIISNKDFVVSVMVIVNEKDVAVDNSAVNNEEHTEISEKISDDIALLDSKTLLELYKKGQQLSVKKEGYEIIVDGKKIINYHNELNTDISLKVSKDTTFVVNEGNPLCSPIVIKFDKKYGKYLYLYDESKGKYEYLACENIKEIHISVAGKYMITSKKLSVGSDLVVYVLIGSAVFIVIGFVVYVFVKRKYWFW